MKVHRLAAFAAVLVVAAATPANAVPVTYSTSGIFTSSGNATLSQGGAVITFNPLGVTTVNPPPDTHALFGSFTTTSVPSASPGATLSDTFTLTITQTAPGPGSIVYTSTVSGTIFLGNTQAFVQFNGPLTRTITSGGSTTTYRIVEGDEFNLGRVDLLPNPGEVSRINGEIGVIDTAVIPEPGTMALACIALPLLGLGYVRNRRRKAQA